MDTKLVRIFARLGCSKNAAPVYAAAENARGLNATSLARAAGLHRPAAYRGMSELLELGLLKTEMRGKRAFYRAAPRARIEALFAAVTNEAQALVRRSKAKETSVITVFEGPAGVASVFDDVASSLKRGDTFYRFTSERDLAEVNSYLSPSYRTVRDRKRLERQVISNPRSGSQKRARLERFIKYLGRDGEAFDENAIELVYGDKIALVDLNSMESMIIKNATLAAFQRTIFKALYKRL
jgi:sugar-specific transcriptional regulator TrmB